MSFPSYLAELRAFLPQNAILTDPLSLAPYLKEWRNRFTGAADGVVFPDCAEQITRIIRLSLEHNVPITPQGGNTGLVGGQIPDPNLRGMILSLNRMNRIRSVHPLDYAIIAEAGVTVADVQKAASEKNLRFPFSIASEGSAQIGGVISTNAGGLNAVKHGLIEDLTIGLEAVTPTGEIYHGLKIIKKDNQGFDVKRLFIGTEGVYGIVTAASLRLIPKPTADICFALALRHLRDTPEVLAFIRNHTDETPEEFELIPAAGFICVNKHKQLQIPFSTLPDYALLIRLSSVRSEEKLYAEAEKIIAALYEKSFIKDAAIPSNLRQMQELRNFRELLSECQKYEGASIKHDVSVPVSKTPELIERGIISARKILPDIRPFPFGHAGDGNIHFNFSAPLHMNKEDFMRYEPALNDMIFEIVAELGGSFSAEHGIGRLRRETLTRYGDPVANSLRVKLKQILDPNGLFNRGKTLPI